MGQHFYTTSPLVVETRMLLRCKPLLPSRRECLSTSIVPCSAICPYRYIHMDIRGGDEMPLHIFIPPRSKETGRPEKENCEAHLLLCIFRFRQGSMVKKNP